MTIAIMQPYFFPYIGYFQLMMAVEEFVVYDNIEYAKKGWINRNRILVNDTDTYITLPLKKDSDYLDIKNRYLAESWKTDRAKMLNRITESYRKAPYFGKIFSLIEGCILFDNNNLFDFIFNSILRIKKFLDISSTLVVSSAINADHSLKSKDKVIAICKERNATAYINPIGGFELYSKKEFKENGLELYFLKANSFTYKQFENEFIPWLSIIDVLMFNDESVVRRYLSEHYSLL